LLVDEHPAPREQHSLRGSSTRLLLATVLLAVRNRGKVTSSARSRPLLVVLVLFVQYTTTVSHAGRTRWGASTMSGTALKCCSARLLVSACRTVMFFLMRNLINVVIYLDVCTCITPAILCCTVLMRAVYAVCSSTRLDMFIRWITPLIHVHSAPCLLLPLYTYL
jgi:hypothetical protein